MLPFVLLMTPPALVLSFEGNSTPPYASYGASTPFLESAHNPYCSLLLALCSLLTDEVSNQPNLILGASIPLTVANLTPNDAEGVILLTQTRNGQQQEFQISPPNSDTTPSQVIEVIADRQEYNEQQGVVIAEGNVEVRFAQGVLTADRVQVNLANEFIVAEGDVALLRGEQILRGERFEYSVAQDSGTILNARGEVFLPTLTQDSTFGSPTRIRGTGLVERPLSDRILANQPLQHVTTQDGYAFVLGSDRDVENLEIPESGGQVNRLRFQAEQIEFERDRAEATNIRITNDPFSPPELELRADTATFTRFNELRSVIRTTDSRIVFDDGLSIPIFQDRIILDEGGSQDPLLFSFGYDDEDRGGLFVQQNYNLISTDSVQATVSPQLFLQRAIFDEGIFDPSILGATASLEVELSPTTTFNSSLDLTSLDLTDVEEELRANFQLRQLFGNLENPYLLNLEYSYRDRIFNGSLGLQTVRSSIGAVLLSPEYTFNNNLNFQYQLGIQQIVAESGERDERIGLTRYQAAAAVERDFPLWQGESLEPTPTAGLRYTAKPVLPYLNLTTELRGIYNQYSNDEAQRSLSGTIGIEGQLGNFSRQTLDYTAFNVGYTQVILDGESPFEFDRIVDTSILSLGIMQQIYGPFLLGFQTSYNLEDQEQISTDYLLQYNRRTYSIVIRYNPVVELGSFSFRINDFNWFGSPRPFDAVNSR